MSSQGAMIGVQPYQGVMNQPRDLSSGWFMGLWSLSYTKFSIMEKNNTITTHFFLPFQASLGSLYANMARINTTKIMQ